MRTATLILLLVTAARAGDTSLLPMPVAAGVSGLMRAADLDGSGADELVIAASGSVQTWRWTPHVSPTLLGSTGNSASSSLAIGDLDEDGLLDALTTGVGSGGNVDWFKGRGDGTLFPPLFVAADVGSGGPSVLCDANLDGHLDIALDDWNSKLLRVLLGHGDATFDQVAPISIPFLEPGPMSTADLQGDGLPDVVVGRGSTQLAVLKGIGGGAFASPDSYVMLTHLAGLALVDVSGDGVPDMEVSAGTSPGFAWRRGLGDGTFAPAKTVAGFDILAQDLVAGDTDGDGDPDLWMCDSTGPAQELRGEPGGPVVGDSIVTTHTLSRLQVGEFTGDGRLDLITSGSAITLVEGGPGGLQPAPLLLPGQEALDLFAGDADGDGLGDLLWVGGGPGGLKLLRGTGVGVLGDEVDSDTIAGDGFMTCATVGRFDADVHPDLVMGAVNSSGPPPAVPVLRVYRGSSSGSFTPISAVALPNAALSLAPADIDGNGTLDLFECDTGGRLRVVFGKSDGTLQVAGSILVNAASTLDAGDVDGDGELDVVVTSGPSDLIWIATGDGTGQFHAVTTMSCKQTFDVALNDFDADGRLDIVAAEANGVSGPGLSLFRGQPGGAFVLAQSFDHTQVGALDNVELGDVDGDGLPDVVAGREDHVSVFRARPDGLLQQPLAFTANARHIAIGDLDGDGVADVSTLGDENSTSTAGVRVLLAHPYQSWENLGHALAGASGEPALKGYGDPHPGAAIEIELSHAKPASLIVLVAGLDAIFAPFKGGTLVPSPDLIVDGLVTDPSGHLLLSSTLPFTLPPDLSFTVQAWFHDAGGPAGFAASNGLSASLP